MVVYCIQLQCSCWNMHDDVNNIPSPDLSLKVNNLETRDIIFHYRVYSICTEYYHTEYGT